MKRRRKRYPCPCCGRFTLPEQGEYDVCPVCFWEDDPTQSADELDDGGANRICLIEARKNYLAFGACESDKVKYVRKPRPVEINGTRNRKGV